MSEQVPKNLFYTASHEWLSLGDDGIATVGITAHAKDLLGDLVFIELPEVGREVNAAEETAVVESVKAASDVYSPLAGEVVKVNQKLVNQPEKISESPYEEGWLFKIKLQAGESTDKLLSAQAYLQQISES